MVTQSYRIGDILGNMRNYKRITKTLKPSINLNERLL